MNCIPCRYHSPFAANQYSQEWKQWHMSPDVFFKIIDEAHAMNVRLIQVSGSGEPFLHPHILSFIRYIKERGMQCRILTNGSVINDSVLGEISGLKLDTLLIGLWDCDGERYESLRPGGKLKLTILKKWLKTLKDKKESFPKIHFVYLLSDRNYNCISEMYKFAKEYNAQYIKFGLFRFYYGETTNALILSQNHIPSVIAQLSKLPRKIRSQRNSNINEFLLFLKSIKIENETYSSEVLDDIPCYVGWVFLTIDVNGNVLPCCRCDNDKPMGNIYKNNLTEIWNSKAYKEFRHFALKSKGRTASSHGVFHCRSFCTTFLINFRINRYFGRLVNLMS